VVILLKKGAGGWFKILEFHLARRGGGRLFKKSAKVEFHSPGVIYSCQD